MKAKPTEQKLRGGYYTPPALAEFLASWAIRTSKDTVFEPSCGDGNMLCAAAEVLRDSGTSPERIAEQVLGVEHVAGEAEKARRRLRDMGIPVNGKTIATGDFFGYCATHLKEQLFFGEELQSAKRFDAVIGNPPFIRYQDFQEAHREVAFQLIRDMGFSPNRLTNAWLPFLVVSAGLLKPDGRLAMVIPAELFQVKYAAEARKFLSHYFPRLTIATFKTLVFEGIQQEVVLLLGERAAEGERGIRVVEHAGAEALGRFDESIVNDVPVKPMHHSTEKWTQYFLTKEEIQLLRRLRRRDDLTWTGDVMNASVGIVTGNNGYFILSREEAGRRGLNEHVEPIVTRSAHLSGGIFTEADWNKNADEGRGSLLFMPPKVPHSRLPESVSKYVMEGEAAEEHTGYKCRIRDPWYVVPSVWTPDAFMLRQVHAYPKLVLNEVGATCTDTIHRVRFHPDENSDEVPEELRRQYVAAFLNSLTFVFGEVTGRSYGGGVLTFEPSEARDLPLPLEGAENLDLKRIDQLLREDDIESILDETDQVLLSEGMGLSGDEVAALRGAWNRLRDRRIHRK